MLIIVLNLDNDDCVDYNDNQSDNDINHPNDNDDIKTNINDIYNYIGKKL